MLCDFLTMLEHSGGHRSRRSPTAYLGDARNNMGNSLLVMGALMGSTCASCAPKAAVADAGRQRRPASVAEHGRAHASRSPRTSEQARAASTSSTPTCGSRWASRRRCGTERIALLHALPGEQDTLAATGNPSVKFMHCLPGVPRPRDQGRRANRRATRAGRGLEVTHEVFESERHIAFDQAENRLHTIKALMVATLGG